MNLTTEVLTPYVGGQMEIQNRNEGYIFRGEIKTIKVENNTLKVGFAWLGKGEGYPPVPRRWVSDQQLQYEASLDIYSASNIGPSGGDVGGSDRLSLNSSIVGELVVIYPPDGSKIDRSKVEGLEPAA